MHLPTDALLKTVTLDRIGNVGAGEDTLLQLWLPPNLLRNDGDSVFIHAVTALAANANSKATRLYIGSTVVATRGATDNGLLRDMRVRAYRRGATSLWSVGLTANGPTATQLTEEDDITIDLSEPIELKLTGEGVANDDIVSRVLRYVYIPVGSVSGF